MRLTLKNLKDKFSQEKFSLGLDIGSHSLKFVVLRFLKAGIELCNFKIEPIEANLGQALKGLMQAQKVQKINTSMSGQSTIIRYVDFPQMSEDELRKALHFEAPKHIPFLLEEVSLDAHILKSGLPDNRMLVMIAAVKKDFLNTRLRLLEEAGFKPNIIDMDSLALVNAFNFNYSDDENLRPKTVALLNIGAQIINLTVLADNLIPRLSRDIQLKDNMPIQVQEEARFESMLQAAAGEIRTSFDYYESQGSSSIHKVFLSGGSSLIPGLKDKLESLLGIEIDYWDAFRRINIASDIDSGKLKGKSGQLAVAVGLALRK